MRSWFFKKRPKKGTPISLVGMAEGLAGIDNCLATMEVTGGCVNRENGRITIVPPGSGGLNFWRDFTATGETETGDFKTEGAVVIGSDTITALDGELIMGDGTDSIVINPLASTAFVCAPATGLAFDIGSTDGVLSVPNQGSGGVVFAPDSSNFALQVAGVDMVTNQGAAVTDAAAVTGTATSGGYGFASAAEFNAFVSGVNTIKTQLNAALARLRAHGLIAT